MAKATLIETLRRRGMIDTLTPGAAEQLSKETTSIYIGFDPTAASFHIGNLATILLLKHAQLTGHKPVVVLGGATGMVGDPSFKAKERVLQKREQLVYNQSCLEQHIARFLDTKGPYAAKVVNNYDWFRDMHFLTFLREVGKYIPISYMLAKDSVRQRLKTGISYTEFAYQLLQGYDFYHLYTRHGVKMQMGGADQWGNITTGIELIRKKAQGAAYGLTTPLITKADGSKFGKTEAGNIWLDEKLTSPYTFYQFWMQCSDEDALLLIPRMTLYSMQEIADLIARHQQEPHKRILQRAIAEALTTFVHSGEAAAKAAEVSYILFGEGSEAGLHNVKEEWLLACLEGVPHIRLAATQLEQVTSAAELLSYATGSLIFTSKRAAREVIQAGGIRINKSRIDEADSLPQLSWICGKYLLVQKGKKHFYLLERA